MEDYHSIDWSLYGALVRNYRIKAGIKKAPDFAKLIYRHTRVKVNQDTIYKIEQGKQQPNAEQFLAINIVLFDSCLPKEVTDFCFSEEFSDYIKLGPASIPDAWKYENFKQALEEYSIPRLGSSPLGIALEVHDNPIVFEDFEKIDYFNEKYSEEMSEQEQKNGDQ